MVSISLAHFSVGIKGSKPILKQGLPELSEPGKPAGSHPLEVNKSRLNSSMRRICVAGDVSIFEEGITHLLTV